MCLPRGTQLAVPHQLAGRAEGSLGGDYMRAEEARHGYFDRAIGMRIVNVAPCPGGLDTLISPPCFWTIS